MSKHVGRLGAFGVAKEATRGTLVVPPTFWIPRSVISFDDKTETAREEEGLGKIADSDANFVTQRRSEGSVETNLDDKTLGIILTSLMGASPTTTGGPTYAHAYTLSNSNQHRSLTLAYKDPDLTKIFPLSVVDSLRMVIEPNAIVQFEIGFKGRASRDWTALTPDFTALGNKFLHQHLVFKLASAVGGLSGATPISLKRLEITISANTEFDSVLGTVEPEDILGQQFSVEGTITLNKEDETYRRYMLDGTYRAMDISLVRASNSSFQLQLPRVDFSEWEQDRTLNQIVSQSINFKGNYDAANAADIISTCTLTNTYAGTSY